MEHTGEKGSEEVAEPSYTVLVNYGLIRLLKPNHFSLFRSA